MDPTRHQQWLQFAEACKEFWGQCEFQEQLIAACGGQEDIAWAVYYHHGKSSLEWLEGPVPYLGKTRRTGPAALIQRGQGDRVRECLWRTP